MKGVLFCFFFFSSRRRHTRLQGDWSSDVCSSDLATGRGGDRAREDPRRGRFRRAGALRRPAHPSRARGWRPRAAGRSEEHTSELQSPCNLVCRLLLEKKKKYKFTLILCQRLIERR